MLPTVGVTDEAWLWEVTQTLHSTQSRPTQRLRSMWSKWSSKSDGQTPGKDCAI